MCAVNAIRNIAIDQFTGSGIMLTNNETKDNMKVIKSLENKVILLKGTTRKNLSAKKGDFLIFLDHSCQLAYH